MKENCRYGENAESLLFFFRFLFFLNRESVGEKGESREGGSREGGNCNVTGDWDESCRVPLDVYQE